MKLGTLSTRVENIWSALGSIAFFLFIFLDGCSRPSSKQKEDAFSLLSDDRLPDAVDQYYNEWSHKKVE